MTQLPLEQVVDHIKKLLRRGDVARAAPILGDIVRQAGPAPLTRMMQGMLAAEFGQYEQSIALLEQVSFELIGDDQRDATIALARARTLAGDPDGALITIEPVCETDDAPGSAHRVKAQALVAAGRNDDAAAHLKSVPEGTAEPHEIALAWAALALEADRGDPIHETAIAHLSTERERVGVPAAALADICLAYGELHARAGDDAPAASLFKRSLSLNPTKVDPRPYAQTVMKIINGWSDKAVSRAQRLDTENADPRPVFVVGTPGGGPELVAALLAAHTDVHVADHPEALTAMVGRHLVGKPGVEPIIDDPSKPGTAQLRAAAEGYLERIHAPEQSDTGPARIVDAYPLNLHILGLVAQFFPGARVIVARRDPFDACFGCMMKHRDARMIYANNPQATAVFAGGLRRLEDHWLSIFAGEHLPLQHLDIAYEDLSSDPSAPGRLFEFLGLTAPDTAETDRIRERHLRWTGHQTGLQDRFGKRMPELTDAVTQGEIGRA